jgi:hypothetical protein
MKNILKFFNCGNIYETSNHVTFVVTKLSDIEEKIIPFLISILYKEIRN